MMRRVPLALAALILAAALAAPAAADGPPYFARRDTWLETAIAGRETLARQAQDAAAKARTAREADPAMKAFQPLDVTVTGREDLREVRLRVAGLKRVFVGTSGERRVFLADFRVLDASGRDVTPDLDKVRERNVDIDRGGNYSRPRDWQDVKRANRTFKRGIMLERAEIEIHLPPEAETLEATAGSHDWNYRGMLRLWVDCASVGGAAHEQSRTLRDLAGLVREAFPDPVSLQEQQLEDVCGIWADPWTPGDWPALALRYARRSGPLAKAAEERAARCAAVADLVAVRDLFYVQYAVERAALARRTLEFVERSAPRPALAARLADLEGRLAAAQDGGGAGAALHREACLLRREIILSHPDLDFPRLLVNKRSGRLPEHMCDQYLGRHSQAAAGLVVLENWRGEPTETAPLAGLLPKGATLQPDLSYDGRRVVFAFADHETERAGDRRGYYLYEYSFDSGKVRRITGTDADPWQGRGGRETVLIEDFDPCWLPDGGIAFISTRSQQYGRCHGSRYVPSYTLYRTEADGTGIRALSYNESNEWAPSVLADGSLVYCRWDYINRHDTIFQSLWTMRPDGTQTGHYYGNFSRAPCMISEPQTIPGTSRTVSTAAAHHGQTLGTLIVVDPSKGQEDGAPLVWLTPEFSFPESPVPAGITRAAEPPPAFRRNGRASTPWPLSEDLYLCAYQHGEGRYAVYLVDTLGGRELIYADPQGGSVFDPIPLRPRPLPPRLPSMVAAAADAPATGVFYVQNVYESTQPIPPGSVQRIRINQILPQPTRSVPQRSAASNEIVKRVLGTVPINADGSATFEAPADTPLQLQLLGADGMAVMTMRSLVYLQRGEQAACVGCHEPRSSAPPALPPRRLAVAKIEPPAGPRYDGGLSFMRTVQPVLDRYCVGCHAPGKEGKRLDLTGGFERTDESGRPAPRDMREFSVAYESLIRSGTVKIAQRNGETPYSKPGDYFARAGRLGPMLVAGHPGKDGRPRIALDRESLQRVLDWLDLNAQFYGDYSFNRVETRPASAGGEKALREAVARRFGPETAALPLAMLINTADPAQSRILMAPLPAAAGGWGQMREGAYAGADDPARTQMRTLVEAAIQPLESHDVAGTCGRPNGCRCGNCWVHTDAEARRAHLAAQPVARR
jgi:hypothetical protein